MKWNKYLVAGLLMCLVSWLMTGLSVDDEFYESYKLFLKHRPSLQYYFRSPLGMQDMPADYPDLLRQQESAYDEFVLKQHWSSGLDLLAQLFVLLNLIILILGIVKGFKANLRSKMQRK